ncbi:MAG: hypothetical protein K2O41_05450 [Clostridia bacterium]|nr:hypothetical protein [Clostridia bacterium]
MKKFILLTLPLFIICTLCGCKGGCKKGVNYLDYVSERRTDIYLYSNDGLEIKIYLSERETPYCADGIKGDVSSFTEVFVTLPKNYEEVNISLGGVDGEMNYRAVENCYYLSFSACNISGEDTAVTLKYGDVSADFTAVNVKYSGVMDCDSAVKCVIEHQGELFESMTDNGIFTGEIFVRLLYDEGCYYYVGVCNRDKKINAYLVDGERGKIIAAKELG